jgi:hypothetical protein
MAPTDRTTRRTLSARTRFEVFKRDEFQCRYCGRRSPEVILEVDHVVPVCEGGDDDPINLVTACWECNSGKSGNPLAAVITAEDPHDRAILIIERERQLREYNHVLEQARLRKEAEGQELVDYWCTNVGTEYLPQREWTWLLRTLDFVPAETIRKAMLIAIQRNATRGLRYVMACIRNWTESGEM